MSSRRRSRASTVFAGGTATSADIVELDIAGAANRRLDEVTEKLAGYAEQVFARNVPDSSQD